MDVWHWWAEAARGRTNRAGFGPGLVVAVLVLDSQLVEQAEAMWRWAGWWEQPKVSELPALVALLGSTLE
jgi:hypothetical protein